MIQESCFLAGERPARKGWRRGPSLLLSAGPGGGGGGGEGEVALPGPLRDQMQEGKARCLAGGAEGRWVPRADMGEGPEAQAGLGQGVCVWLWLRKTSTDIQGPLTVRAWGLNLLLELHPFKTAV